MRSESSLDFCARHDAISCMSQAIARALLSLGVEKSAVDSGDESEAAGRAKKALSAIKQGPTADLENFAVGMSAYDWLDESRKALKQLTKRLFEDRHPALMEFSREAECFRDLGRLEKQRKEEGKESIKTAFLGDVCREKAAERQRDAPL